LVAAVALLIIGVPAVFMLFNTVRVLCRNASAAWRVQKHLTVVTAGMIVVGVQTLLLTAQFAALGLLAGALLAPVDDSERSRQVGGQCVHGRCRKRAGHPHRPVQRDAVHVLGGQPRNPAVGVGVHDRRCPRVADAAAGGHLAGETGPELLVGREPRVHELERNRTAGPDGEMDLTHPVTTEERRQPTRPHLAMAVLLQLLHLLPRRVRDRARREQPALARPHSLDAELKIIDVD
jgi:hypothetical protein